MTCDQVGRGDNLIEKERPTVSRRRIERLVMEGVIDGRIVAIGLHEQIASA